MNKIEPDLVHTSDIYIELGAAVDIFESDKDFYFGVIVHCLVICSVVVFVVGEMLATLLGHDLGHVWG